MSIKVYDGYKFPLNTKFEDIQAKYMELIQSEFYNDVQKCWNKIYLTIFCHCLDNKDLFENYTSASKETDKLINKWLIQQLNNESTMFDITAKLVIFSYNNQIYCRLMCSNNYIRSYLIKHFNLEEYYYSSAFDKPEEFSDSEWEERYNVWDKFEPAFVMNIIYKHNYKIAFFPYISEKLLNENIDLLLPEYRAKQLVQSRTEELLIKNLQLIDLKKYNKNTEEYNKIYLSLKKDIKLGKYQKEIKIIEEIVKKSMISIDINNFKKI